MDWKQDRHIQRLEEKLVQVIEFQQRQKTTNQSIPKLFSFEECKEILQCSDRTLIPSIALIAAGKGRLEILDWWNDDPQPVCYVDREMLEEDIQERIELLIPSLGIDLEELRKKFFFVSRVSQPDTIEDFLSLDLDRHQLDLLNWIMRHTADNSHPIVILDNLSNLVYITDKNSAGQMQNFNMMVTKARKKGCSMVIVHHTGKSLNIGPDGFPTWRGSYDMATRLDKTICLLPCQSSLDGFMTFQVIEGKSRKGQRINLSIQFNPFDKK